MFQTALLSTLQITKRYTTKQLMLDKDVFQRFAFLYHGYDVKRTPWWCAAHLARSPAQPARAFCPRHSARCRDREILRRWHVVGTVMPAKREANRFSTNY